MLERENSISTGQMKLQFAFCVMIRKTFQHSINLGLSVAVQFAVTLSLSTSSLSSPLNRTIPPKMCILRNLFLSSILLIAVAAKPDCNCNPPVSKKGVSKVLSPKSVKASAKHPNDAKPVVASVPTTVTPVSFMQEKSASLVVSSVDRDGSDEEVEEILQESGEEPAEGVDWWKGTHKVERFSRSL